MIEMSIRWAVISACIIFGIVVSSFLVAGLFTYLLSLIHAIV